MRTVRVEVEVRPFAVGGDVVDGVGRGGRGVEDDVADQRAVEEGVNAENFRLLGRGDDCAEVDVGVADMDVRGVLAGNRDDWRRVLGS